MTPTLSLLHASYGRPEKAVAAMRMWIDRAVMPGKIEYVVAANTEDEATIKAFESANETRVDSMKLVTGPFKGSAAAWNEAAKESTGMLLIQVSDDFECPEGWNELLNNAIITRGGGIDWPTKPIFVLVSDGFRKGHLATMAVMTRPYFMRDGYFLMPSFRSVFSDDHVSFRALKRRDAGECVYIEAKDLVFQHRHHYHDKSVPEDATYLRQNSAENYDHGARLFAALNPDAADSPLIDWR